jgi:hypothetical protein
MVSLATECGTIEADTLYELSVLRERCGWGEVAIRRARKAGLRVIHRAGRYWVRGSDFIEYIENEGATQR